MDAMQARNYNQLTLTGMESNPARFNELVPTSPRLPERQAAPAPQQNIGSDLGGCLSMLFATAQANPTVGGELQQAASLIVAAMTKLGINASDPMNYNTLA